MKRFEGRVALFWVLWPPDKSASNTVTAEWRLAPLVGEVNDEVERLNRAISLASKRERPTDYDVALSFAGEDRAYVDDVAESLRRTGVKVFYDTFETANLWGTNLYEHLSDVYQKRARFTVIFISKRYAEKAWPNFERQAAQARALGSSREYILPARFDETELPGILPTTAYVPLQTTTPAALAALILQKLQSDSPQVG